MSWSKVGGKGHGRGGGAREEARGMGLEKWRGRRRGACDEMR